MTQAALITAVGLCTKCSAELQPTDNPNFGRCPKCGEQYIGKPLKKQAKR